MIHTHTHTQRGDHAFLEQTAEQFEVCLMGLSVCSDEASVEDLKLCVRACVCVCACVRASVFVRTHCGP